MNKLLINLIFVFFYSIAFNLSGQDTTKSKVFYDTIFNIKLIDSTFKISVSKLDSIFNIRFFSIDSFVKNKKEYLDTSFIFFKKHKKKFRNQYKNLEEIYDIDLDAIGKLKGRKKCSELEEELNKTTKISTRNIFSTRNAPNIITIINEEKIRKSGARDLIDILKLVPSFHFALDEKGKVGLGIRGNWSNEGKVLMMIDGQEFNEIFTGKLYFGNRFPVDMIKRIEIIRGAGSADYGGFAEFAVINIITYNSKDTEGLDVFWVKGKADGMLVRNNFGLFFRKNWQNSDLSIQFFSGYGQRSNKEHLAFYDMRNWSEHGISDIVSLRNESDIKPNFFSLKYRYKNFSFKTLIDNYEVKDLTNLDIDKRHKTILKTETIYNEAKYNLYNNKKVNLISKVNLIIQSKEINSTNADTIYSEIENLTVKIKPSLLLYYKFNHRIKFTVGTEFFVDAFMKDENIEYTEKSKKEDINALFNASSYIQGVFRLNFFNLTTGIRYEKNYLSTSKYLPRIALTKRFGKINFKFMIGLGFRNPTAGNIANSFTGKYEINADTTEIINIERELKAETTEFFEFEIGYQFSKKLFAKANIYSLITKNTIVYYTYRDDIIDKIYENTNQGIGRQLFGLNVYQNFESSGTNGFELETKFKDNWGSLECNYSFYTTKGKNVIPVYSISKFDFDIKNRENNIVKNNAVLAFPKHQFSLDLMLNITNDLSIRYNFIRYGERYAHMALTKNDSYYPLGKLKKYPASYISDIYLNIENLFFQGFRFGFGFYDIFNSNYKYVQPYFGYNAELPRTSREFFFKISYDFSAFK